MDAENTEFDKTKKQLLSEVKFVYDKLSAFDATLQKKIFPEKVYLIDKSWFDKWKDRVNWKEYDQKVNPYKKEINVWKRKIRE